MSKKSYLITGAAGFIGYHLARMLLIKGETVIGFDNLNEYYDVRLKNLRLQELKQQKNFNFVQGDLSDQEVVDTVFETYRPQIAVNLGAQAGVRYSIDHPRAYINSNVIGFFNMLEACRQYPVHLLLFASSSSVYGNQKKIPFSVSDPVDKPVSLYAATKKSNELMAYTYSHLFKIPAIGLRFFTVYGPYGRPDMAYFKFADRIMKDKPIQIYNNGKMLRDFTYIDDIVSGMMRMMDKPPESDENGAPYKLYNIGNHKPESLMHFIEVLENVLGKRAQKQFLPMQDGDVYQTFADIGALQQDFGFQPQTTIEDGLSRFAVWYREYQIKREEWG